MLANGSNPWPMFDTNLFPYCYKEHMYPGFPGTAPLYAYYLGIIVNSTPSLKYFRFGKYTI